VSRAHPFRATLAVEGLRKLLVPATLAYLGLPVAVFLLGWLRPLAGVPLTLALALAVARAGRTTGAPGEAKPRAVSPAGLAAALLPFAAVVAAAAVGVVLDFNTDWALRFEIFRDLVIQPWPVIYETDAGPLALVYYITWFLPAALAAKVAGWSAAMATLLVWSALGFALVVGWLAVLVRMAPLLASLLFLGFAGIEIWQNLLEDGLWNTLREVAQGDSFQWQKLFWYFPTHAVIARGPDHALPAWLLAAFVLDAAERRDPHLPTGLLMALALAWSPFAAVGLVPLLLGALLCAEGSARERLHAQLGAVKLAGWALAVVMFGYYASRWVPYALPEIFVAGVASSEAGFWLARADVETASFLRTWAIFCAITFLGLSVPLLAVYRPGRGSSPRAVLVLAATLFLLVLPFYRYGYFNDLPHRASLACIFVLLVLALDVLSRPRRHPVAAAALALVLSLGAASAAAQARRYTNHLEWCLRHRPLRLVEPQQDMFERQLTSSFDRITQYVGSTRSPFFRILADASEPRRIPTPLVPRERVQGLPPCPPLPPAEESRPGAASAIRHLGAQP